MTRVLVACVLSVLLTACAAGSGDSETQPPIATAERVAELLAGRYAGRSPDGDGALVRLEAEVGRVAANGVEMTLIQRAEGDRERRFALQFAPTRVATRLEGRFAPLSPEGRAVGACPLTVVVRSDGFVASTSAETCRFGQGARETALVKEIAHDGQRLVIADRLLAVDDGDAVGPDRVLELDRVRLFEAWAGVAEGREGAWRVARSFSLASDGVPFDPVDAAGMPLGISVELAPHRVREDAPPVLRLRVFDRESGELLAQSWGESRALRLGVALPGVQIGLSAARR